MVGTIYEKNLEAIEKRWSDYAKEIKHGIKDNGLSIEVINCSDRIIPIVSKDGKTYQLDSIYNDSVIDKWLTYVDLDKYEINVFMFGIGDGIYVRKFLDKTNGNNNARILVYEPDFYILGKCIKYYDMTDVFSNERFILIVPMLNRVVFRDEALRFMNYNNMNDAQFFAHMNYPHIYPEQMEDYVKESRKLIDKMIASRKFLNWASQLHYRNTIGNISRFANGYSYASLKEKLPKDVPAIIVASGPSLKKNIAFLPKAKGRSFIIAVDSALKTLDKEGIVPDIYISIDPDKNKGYFEVDNLRNIPAVGYIMSPPHMYADDQIEFISIGEDKYIKEFLDNNMKERAWEIKAGGSVATSAFLFAAELGYQTIIMIGLDLAYTDDKAHVHNEKFEVDDVNKDYLFTVDIYGKKVKTNWSLEFYRNWLEDEIAVNPQLRVIDATEGGAYIKGTELMTLEHVIDELCTKEVDIGNCIAECSPLFDDKKKQEFYKWMEDIPYKMNLIMEKSNIVLLNYDKIESIIDQHKGINDEVKRLLCENKRYTEEIEADPVYDYIEYLNAESAQEAEKTINTIDEDPTKDILKVCNLGKAYIGGVIKAANAIIQDLNKGDGINEG